MKVTLQKSPMSLQAVVSVCWSTCWSGCRWSRVMWNSRWDTSIWGFHMSELTLDLLECLQAAPVSVCLVFQVLKIFVHLCSHGSNQFLTELRRNSTFIQQASGSTLFFFGPIYCFLTQAPTKNWSLHFNSVYSGPPDPIHGSALYQKVRNTAQVS